jgi:hypothetical protein
MDDAGEREAGAGAALALVEHRQVEPRRKSRRWRDGDRGLVGAVAQVERVGNDVAAGHGGISGHLGDAHMHPD